MITNKAVKLVQTRLDFHRFVSVDELAIRRWLQQEIGNTDIAYDLLEAQVEQLMENKWAVGRLYLTEQRMGLAA